jgi:hypothetical protein
MTMDSPLIPIMCVWNVGRPPNNVQPDLGNTDPRPQSLPPAKPLVRDSSVQSTNSSDDVDDDSDYTGNVPQKKVKVSTKNRNNAAQLAR